MIASLGPDGPWQCSGLDVVRYNEKQLEDRLGDGFELLGSDLTTHLTPMGKWFVDSEGLRFTETRTLILRNLS